MVQDPLLNTFISLILVVAVLAIILFLVKRYALKARKMKPEGMGLEVVSRVSLQPKTHLYVVKVGDKKLLIGANDHSINTLADITENQDQNAIRKQIKKGFSPQESFNNYKQPSTKKQVDANPLSFKNFLNQTFRKS